MKQLTISICKPFLRWKSHTIFKHEKPNALSPIAFIQKARGVKQEDFDAVVAYLKRGVENEV